MSQLSPYNLSGMQQSCNRAASRAATELQVNYVIAIALQLVWNATELQQSCNRAASKLCHSYRLTACLECNRAATELQAELQAELHVHHVIEVAFQLVWPHPPSFHRKFADTDASSRRRLLQTRTVIPRYDDTYHERGATALPAPNFALY